MSCFAWCMPKKSEIEEEPGDFESFFDRPDNRKSRKEETTLGVPEIRVNEMRPLIDQSQGRGDDQIQLARSGYNANVVQAESRRSLENGNGNANPGNSNFLSNDSNGNLPNSNSQAIGNGLGNNSSFRASSNNLNGGNGSSVVPSSGFYTMNMNPSGMYNNYGNGLNDVIITDLEVQKYPKLELFETEGNILNGKYISITAAGMVGGERNKRDGLTCFGYRKYDYLNKPINDFILNIPFPSEIIATVFKIQFDKNDQQYYLMYENNKDESAVVFVKLETRLMLKKKQILSLGEMHISVNIDDQKNLLLEIVYQNEETKTRVFSKDNFKQVRIGRVRTNEIVLENYAYSRVHTTFIFDDKFGEWFVQDGIDDKKSTNGTWLYLDWKWKIENFLNFRVGTSFLSIKKTN